ncbi:hypothetical protein F0919_00840 [Taibaiella lutea]|uniref:Delta-aminolevulinic acid dehydratase n=1 Tax=Taibaiella lutea TaxID=2608001 RepID=A0A5M6CM85_9BACT|nr:hypothetical protein [Taibaiella lutea]KAA5536244.1 hypothetical protein F0919_00840 [Taibaiella lutea]
MTSLESAVFKLKSFIEKEEYKGHDPYDALKSPFFRLPGLKSSKLIRFGAQQFLKRIPVNLRPILLVPKGNNPVTIGLCIQAYAYLIMSNPQVKAELIGKIEYLLSELELLIPEGFSGACWGYDFDWEARRANIPAYQPTVVATGIITNGLFECWKITGIQKCADLVVSSSQFVLRDLNRTEGEHGFCYSYSPFDKQVVLNASMKGVRILAQTFAINKDKSLLNHALPAVAFVLNFQQPNGAFNYSDKGNWVDNYHTGYVLDCLDEFITHFDTSSYNEQLRKGFDYYKNTFFSGNGRPYFYSHKHYPVDCTAAGQSLLTLSRFGEKDKAMLVADWMVKNMQAPNGGFYFRKFKNYIIKTSFMRWSNAWMFAGMAYALSNRNNN